MVRQKSGDLSGRHILVVEDDYLIADETARCLCELGAEVVGPIGSVERANALLDAEGDSVDGAVLDLNVSGTMVFPVADALHARGIPFVFATGYSAPIVPKRYADVPRFEKPVDLTQVARVLHG